LDRLQREDRRARDGLGELTPAVSSLNKKRGVLVSGIADDVYPDIPDATARAISGGAVDDASAGTVAPHPAAA
jgi:hypothetical protein